MGTPDSSMFSLISKALLPFAQIEGLMHGGDGSNQACILAGDCSYENTLNKHYQTLNSRYHSSSGDKVQARAANIMNYAPEICGGAKFTDQVYDSRPANAGLSRGTCPA